MDSSHSNPVAGDQHVSFRAEIFHSQTAKVGKPCHQNLPIRPQPLDPRGIRGLFSALIDKRQHHADVNLDLVVGIHAS